MKNIIFTLIISIAFPFYSQSQLQHQLDSIIKIHVGKGFNGNVLYSKNDSIIFNKSYGFSNFKTQSKLNLEANFHLASCSKQFTAVAMLQLIEKTSLDYHTKVISIFPEFPYENITIYHLLKHQSGLVGYEKPLGQKKYWNRAKQATHQDILRLLIQHKPELVFPAGTKHEYNNTGYAILGCIIEKQSGLSYNQYIENNILIPAGMSSTNFLTTPKKAKDDKIAMGYIKTKDKHKIAYKTKKFKHLNWMSEIKGDMGIMSNLADLEKWKQALKYHKLITPETTKKMFASDSISKKYGFGVAIYNSKRKGKWIYHNGSYGGYKTMMLYLPKSNEFLVILSNNRYEDTYKTMDMDLYKIL